MESKSSVLSKIKNELSTMIVQILPGYIKLIDVMAKSKYGMRIIDLFFESPSKIYELLKEYYGDEMGATMAFYEIFLRPLSRILKYRIDEYEMLNYIRTGRDKEFLEKIIKLYISAQRGL